MRYSTKEMCTVCNKSFDCLQHAIINVVSKREGFARDRDAQTRDQTIMLECMR